MIRQVIEKWVFINYCMQYIGLWNKYDMLNGVVHVLRIQIFNLVMPFLTIPYFYFGGKSGLPVVLIGVLSFFISSKLVLKFVKKNIDVEKLSNLYAKTSRVKRGLNFIFGFLISILCILFLIFSFKILK